MFTNAPFFTLIAKLSYSLCAEIWITFWRVLVVLFSSDMVLEFLDKQFNNDICVGFISVGSVLAET